MMAAPFSFSAPAAPGDDIMEFSTDSNRGLQPTDDIEIDIDIGVGEGFVANEDEHMREGSVPISYKGDEEMVDELPMQEDEIIEDAGDFQLKEQEIIVGNDEELNDADDIAVEPNLLPRDQAVDGETTHEQEPDLSLLRANEDRNQDVPDRHSTVRKAEDPEDEADKPDPILSSVSHEESSAQQDGLTDNTKLSEEVEPGVSYDHAGDDINDGVKPTEQNIALADPVPSNEDLHDDEPYNEDVENDPQQSDDDDDGDEIPETHAQMSPASSKTDAQEPEERQGTSETAESQAHEGSDYSADDPDDHYQAIVSYQENEMFLFPPLHTDDDQEQTYLLTDASLAKATIKALLDSCHTLLGESIPESEDLEMVVPSLNLSYPKNVEDPAGITLAELIDLYVRLQQNDGVEAPEPLKLLLTTRPKMSHRVSALYEAAEQGKGLSLVSTHLHSSEYVSEQTDSPSAPSSDDEEEHSPTREEPDNGVSEDHKLKRKESQSRRPDSLPGTPRGEWLNLEETGTDDIDFRSPNRAFKTNNVDDLGNGLNNGLEVNDGLQDGSDVFGDGSNRQPGKVDDSYGDIFDQTDSAEPAIEAGQGLQANTYSDEHLAGDFDFTAASVNDEVHGTESVFDDPPLPPEVEDDLDEFGDSLGGQAVDSSGAISSTTIHNDATSTQTLQADQHRDLLHNDNADEDEITYGDDLNDFDDLVATPRENDQDPGPSDALSAGPGTLKRQISAVGDEDDVEPSELSQPDAKRPRADDEV